MLLDAMLAWFHYLAIFLLIVALTAQAVLLRPGMVAAALARLSWYDRLYLFSAIAVIATGVLRLSAGAKGAAFYMQNPWFHAKMGLFILIALISIVPTLTFIRWARHARSTPAYMPAPTEISRVRRWVMTEVHLLTFLPLFAALMARGIAL